MLSTAKSKVAKLQVQLGTLDLWQYPAMPVMPFEQHEHVSNDTPPPVEDVYAATHQLLDRKDWGVNGERKTALNIGRLMTMTILSSAGRPRP